MCHGVDVLFTCTSCMMPLKLTGAFVISERSGIASTWRVVRPAWGIPPRYKTLKSSGPVAEIVLRKYSVPFIFTWTSVTLRTTWQKYHRNEQDRQCTYNVTLKHVSKTVDMKNQKVLHTSVCVCVCVRACVCVRVFSTLSHKGSIFGKKLLNIKCVFWFSLQLLFEMFLVLRRIQWDTVINVKTSSCKVPAILFRFW
jgi:hypothetical protein